jgi:hypothetical protein
MRLRLRFGDQEANSQQHYLHQVTLYCSKESWHCIKNKMVHTMQSSSLCQVKWIVHSKSGSLLDSSFHPLLYTWQILDSPSLGDAAINVKAWRIPITWPTLSSVLIAQSYISSDTPIPPTATGRGARWENNLTKPLHCFLSLFEDYGATAKHP